MSAGAAPMSAAAAVRLVRARLARRLDEELDWLDDERPLAEQGIDSVDLISALAAAQLHDGVTVPEELVITRRITLAALGEALARAGAGP